MNDGLTIDDSLNEKKKHGYKNIAYAINTQTDSAKSPYPYN
jgi:hypothetical protein